MSLGHAVAAVSAKRKRFDDAIRPDRMAKPEEIGSVVAFLASRGSSHVTAPTVFADGGLMQSSPGSRIRPLGLGQVVSGMSEGAR